VRLYGKMSRKCFDMRRFHLRRMTLPVKKDIALDPVDIGLLGAIAIVQYAQTVPDLVQQARPRRGTFDVDV